MTRSQIAVLSGALATIAITALLSFPLIALRTGLISSKNTDPKLRLVFHTAGNGDKAVHDFFEQFARNESLDLDDTAPAIPPDKGSRVFAMVMHQGDLVSVKVLSSGEPNQFFVSVYAEKPDPDLNKLETRLTDELRKRWPDTTEYKGP